MKTLKKKSIQLLFASICLVAWSCSETEEPSPTEDVAEIKLVDKGALGEIITDTNGLSLYIFTKDVDGTSACTDDCLSAWPVFYMKDIATSTGLDASDFANITRADGSKQTTYKGWPLYYFASDEVEEDVKGDGVGSVWYAAKSNYSVSIGQQTVEGSELNYLVDATGNSLYYFANDEENVSNCADGCIAAWPVFEVEGALVIPSAFSSNQFGTITRIDGKVQITYGGKPLYYFAQDTKRGEIKGHTVLNWSLSTVQL
ncbi:Secreted repeat of unknown function [Marivirga sericea]|uniref:Lipoprotein with Yx(FWY)xxD motif n=1 Tax=Marivirga sericea TaxID=1028 RepID=A0A1X7IGS5_9BACT|nr:hypothetical protein [Marivirga sericea]SMG13597.1 Secreted repeat of unknown function [Marivirga sericea]